MSQLTSIEICAGAGGQALGLEAAGFHHQVLVEIDKDACQTLRLNRPEWTVLDADVKLFSAKPYEGADLFAGGVPCPPFSVAGKQLGFEDDRDLFPHAIRLIEECKPKAIMLENVRGLLSQKFESYRKQILDALLALGYQAEWKLVYSSDFGVPQLRPRAILIGFQEDYMDYFEWPKRKLITPQSVGETLFEEMKSLGWEDAENWRKIANTIAPTLVGGSKKHGGGDLGPTRARNAWKELGIDGRSLAENPPGEGFKGMPKLTVSMAALIQGFPKDWSFYGSKTSSYRQVGNAFPPPVAETLGRHIMAALQKREKKCQRGKVQELNFASTF